MKQKYCIIYESNHDGWIIEFFSKNIINKTMKNQDNLDIYPCMIINDIIDLDKKIIYCKNPKESGFNPWILNHLELYHRESDNIISMKIL